MVQLQMSVKFRILHAIKYSELFWHLQMHMKGSVKEPNMYHNYETEKITRKASDAAEYIQLFGYSARDRHARRTGASRPRVDYAQSV